MTEVTRIPTKLEEFRAQVLPPDKADDLFRVLPKHITRERFERTFVNAIMAQPKLLDVDPRKVFREVAKIAALGLVLDPQLGECYLIADSKEGVQARVGYRGLMKLARQSGDVETIYSHDICANDTYSVRLGTEKLLEHTPVISSPRGDPIAFYAVIKMKDGSTDFEVMSVAEIEEIRNRSDAWKAYVAKKIWSTPWGTDPGEMSKKTVLRRLLKRAPMSPEAADALAHEDEVDQREIRNATPAPLSLGERLRQVPSSTVSTQGFSQDHIDRETGVVTEDDDRGTEAVQVQQEAPAAAVEQEAEPEPSVPFDRSAFMAFVDEARSAKTRGSLRVLLQQKTEGMSAAVSEPFSRVYSAFDGKLAGKVTPDAAEETVTEICQEV